MSTKKRKTTHVVNNNNNNNLGESESYTDFLCPICLELLIEPITLPCKHELCSSCFEPHIESASLCCPMCRKRLSVWVRENRKKKTLVNQARWELIKKLFPEQVKCRMEGLDTYDTSFFEYSAPTRIIASNGEVRKEYETEMEKLQQEDDVALQLNLEYIRKLEDEEYDEMKVQEEIDRAAAHALQKEEMSNLGVTLASPTEHQKQLLELIHEKSPMQLRSNKTVSKKKHNTINRKGSNKTPKRVDSSPKCTINNFFRQSTPIVDKKAHSQSPCSSKIVDAVGDADYELAKKLQFEYYSESDESVEIISPQRPSNVVNILRRTIQLD